jgi:hypothetical protein
MYSYAFNPLKKILEETTAEDLIGLRQIAEGWYVDYKAEGLNVSDLGKHMSAFSNQYGGWLYFGVKEAPDGSRLADSFPGIATEQVHALSLRVREAASAHVSPPLLYEERLVSGPCEKIGLAEGRAILILGIPQGVDPPYIHSSGRIFRRLSDQSKPEAEKDRYALDRLIERGREFRNRIAERLRRTPELRSEQRDSTFVYIHLAPDLRLPEPKAKLSITQFRDICNNKEDAQGSISIPLDQVHASEFGFVGRQIEDNDPEFARLGMRWWHNGIARLDIPVNVWPLERFKSEPPRYRHSSEFVRELSAQRLFSREICDFAFLVQAVAALTNLYVRLRESTGDFRPLYAACEMRNLFYRVPFFNSARYIDKCRRDGVPLLMERVIAFPERPYFDNMFLLLDPFTGFGASDSDPISSDALPYLRVHALTHWMFSSIGVVADVEELFDADFYTHPLSSGKSP